MIPVRDYLALLSTHLHGLRRQVVGLVVVLGLSIGLQLYAPQLLRRVIDGALSGTPGSALAPLAGVFIVLALASQAVTVIATWLAEDIGWRATNRLRSELAAHVLRLDLSFHTDHSPGHLIERVDGDVTSLSNFFSAMTVQVVGNALLIAGVVVLIARESLLLGMTVGALVAAGLVGFARLHQVTVPWWTEVSRIHAELFGQVGEQVGGTEDIVPNGAAGFMQEQFAARLRRYLPAFRRGWTGYGLMWSTSQVLESATVLAVYVAGSLLLGTSLTIGGVFLVLYYVNMIGSPLHRLRSQFQDLQKAGGAIARIGELRDVVPVMPAAGDRPLGPGAPSLHWDAVTFAYPDEGEDAAPVVHEVDVHVGAGRTLGIVGRTGSGKSTLAKLAVRLHDPDRGAVRLDGVPLPSIAGLRERVGIVTQEVQLFRATVRDNLTFFDADVDDALVRDVLDQLGMAAWLAGLPAGLDTVLDAGELSAGQAQLLAFGRIFLRDPGLVVLDEASSRLDPATETALERAVDRLLAGRTAVVIAHRLHTLDRVDDVLVLDEGRVVEHGPHAQLAADPDSRFAQLLATGMAEVLA